MVRREAGIGQRRGSDGVESVTDRDEEAGIGHQHVLGLAAIGAEAATEGAVEAVQGCDAVGVLTPTAGSAPAAAPWTEYGDGLSDGDTRDALAHLVDVAGVLVAEDEGHMPGEHAFLEVVEQVQVGVAETGSGDLEHDLSGAGRGNIDLDEDGVGLPVGKLDGLHGFSLGQVAGWMVRGPVG